MLIALEDQMVNTDYIALIIPLAEPVADVRGGKEYKVTHIAFTHVAADDNGLLLTESEFEAIRPHVRPGVVRESDAALHLWLPSTAQNSR